jgi:hypothetical protein
MAGEHHGSDGAQGQADIERGCHHLAGALAAAIACGTFSIDSYWQVNPRMTDLADMLLWALAAAALTLVFAGVLDALERWL